MPCWGRGVTRNCGTGGAGTGDRGAFDGGANDGGKKIDWETFELIINSTECFCHFSHFVTQNSLIRDLDAVLLLKNDFLVTLI